MWSFAHVQFTDRKNWESLTQPRVYCSSSFIKYVRVHSRKKKKHLVRVGGLTISLLNWTVCWLSVKIFWWFSGGLYYEALRGSINTPSKIYKWWSYYFAGGTDQKVWPGPVSNSENSDHLPWCVRVGATLIDVTVFDVKLRGLDWTKSIVYWYTAITDVTREGRNTLNVYTQIQRTM